LKFPISPRKTFFSSEFVLFHSPKFSTYTSRLFGDEKLSGERRPRRGEGHPENATVVAAEEETTDADMKEEIAVAVPNKQGSIKPF
jgi:hypothetical protein